ncbi:hypothetical protein JVU11DRAFT_9749 [Chiua virens]|nr:hypothetical protein JVU11DRAFT_9749 [Chiua virens]
MSALHVPPPDATIPELRKKSLTEARAKLKLTTKELRTFHAALPPKKRRGIVNKSVSLDEDIGRVAKKFSMLHLPVGHRGLNPDADLFDKKRWDSIDTKRDAVLTELFRIAPEHLYKEMVKYKPFGSVFTSVLNQERSNILQVVKEASTLVFAPLKIPDPTIFSLPARKKDDPEMMRLSMNHGVYSSATPILYEDPNQTDNDAGFLKNPVLINVLHLLIFGKNVLIRRRLVEAPRQGAKFMVFRV